jgi:hypothetical protein
MGSIVVSCWHSTEEENGLLNGCFFALRFVFGELQSLDYLRFTLKKFPYGDPLNYLFKMKPAIDLEVNFGCGVLISLLCEMFFSTTKAGS